jgi:hypothetical protein
MLGTPRGGRNRGEVTGSRLSDYGRGREKELQLVI